MYQVLVTPPNVDEASLAFLRAQNCNPILPDKPEAQLSSAELTQLLQHVDAWIIGPAAQVTRELIASAPRCKIFARRGVGYDRLDIAAINELGRAAAIATGGNDASVADSTIGLMLAVARRMREQQQAMLAGDWSIKVSTDLYRKTVGIIGMGRTGKAVRQRLKGFEARILATTLRPDAAFAEAEDITFTDLATLLRESDFITIHAPLNERTRHLIGRDELAAMKRGALLINTARGGLVDDKALLDALTSGHLAGAGLDVYEAESEPAKKPVAQALLSLPQVVGTPHAAASTREGLARTNLIIAQVVAALLKNESVPQDFIVTDARA